MIVSILMFLFFAQNSYSVELKIMEYNIAHLGGPNKDTGSPYKEEVASVINEVSPDVVCLIEVDKNTARSGYLDQPDYLWNNTCMSEYYFSKDIDYDGGEYGTLIMTKRPILDSGRYGLDWWGSEQSYLAWVKINVNGKDVYIYNVHLATHDYPEVQDSQVTQSLNYINSHTPTSSYNVIWCGDFNSSSYKDRMGWIRQYFMDAAYPYNGVYRWDGNRNTIDTTSGLNYRFDYIYVDPDESLIDGWEPDAGYSSGNPYSDHMPIVSRVEFFEKGPYLDGKIYENDDSDWTSDSTYISEDVTGDVSWSDTCDIHKVYLTWNSDYLYMGIRSYNAGGKGTIIYLDTDTSTASGGKDFTSAPSDRYPLKVTLNDIGADYQISAWDLGNSDGDRWVDLYKVTAQTPSGTNDYEKYRQGKNFSVGCYPDWKTFEVCIPWYTLYPSGFPTGCKIRYVVASGDTSSVSGVYDSYPDSDEVTNTKHTWNETVNLSNYVEVVIDGNSDGSPDDSSPPSSINSLAILPFTSGKLILKWNPSEDDQTGINSYKVYRSTSPFTATNSGSLIATLNGSTVSSYTDSGLTDGTEYSYIVVSFNGENKMSRIVGCSSGKSGEGNIVYDNFNDGTSQEWQSWSAGSVSLAISSNNKMKIDYADETWIWRPVNLKFTLTNNNGLYPYSSLRFTITGNSSLYVPDCEITYSDNTKITKSFNSLCEENGHIYTVPVDKYLSSLYGIKQIAFSFRGTGVIYIDNIEFPVYSVKGIAINSDVNGNVTLRWNKDGLKLPNGGYPVFNIYRSDSIIDDNIIASVTPIANNIVTNYYVDTAAVSGNKYYYTIVAVDAYTNTSSVGWCEEIESGVPISYIETCDDDSVQDWGVENGRISVDVLDGDNRAKLSKVDASSNAWFMREINAYSLTNMNYISFSIKGCSDNEDGVFRVVYKTNGVTINDDTILGDINTDWSNVKYQINTNIGAKNLVGIKIGLRGSGEYDVYADNIYLYNKDILSPVVLISPTNNLTDSKLPSFEWETLSGSEGYEFQISDSSSFENIIVDKEVSTTSYTPDSALIGKGMYYYWRVRGVKADSIKGLWSETRRFKIKWGEQEEIPTSIGITNIVNPFQTVKIKKSSDSTDYLEITAKADTLKVIYNQLDFYFFITVINMNTGVSEDYFDYNAKLYFSKNNGKILLYYDGVRWVPLAVDTDNGMYRGFINRNGKYKVVSSFDFSKPYSISGNPFAPDGTSKLWFNLKNNITGEIYIYSISGELKWEKNFEYQSQVGWDGKDNNGNLLDTGVYIYILETGSGIYRGTIVLMR